GVVGRLRLDARTVRAGVLAVGARVVHADHHRVRGLTRTRRVAVTADIADDQRTVAEGELGAVVLTDPDPLHKPERGAQPVDRLANVRVDEDGDDGGSRDRAVRLHAGSSL